MMRLSLKCSLLSLALLAASCSSKLKNTKTASSEPNFYNQGNTNRVAAEWEPALGTMIVWPLCVPHKLVIELAKDNHLFTLVENETAKKDALKWYGEWGIDVSRTTFVYAPQGVDSWWVRDWGPSAVFTPEGKMKLADGKYIYSTPVSGIGCKDPLEFLYRTPENAIIKTETDDNATVPLGAGIKTEVLDLPYVNTGGNVLPDGLGSAFSTCILLNENVYYGVAEDQFLQLNKKLLGVNSYHILSNFEKRGIQHIDCFMKLLDTERILVIEPPVGHELHSIYENIVNNELAKLKTPYGRPYEILRIKSGAYMGNALAAYTNSIIVNKTVYVPLFRIKEDALALQRWQEVMPGYTIKGFEFELKNEPTLTQKMKAHYGNYGWNSGDALHCRTRAIWDPEMLFISVKKITPVVDAKQENTVYASIIDYSGKGLAKGKTELVWRLKGEAKWNHIKMSQAENAGNFTAAIPYHKSGSTVEYYISAVSNSGKTETQPRTAPLGTYTFSIQ